jgi:hypothetical protein
MDEHMFTYQTRPQLDETSSAILEEYARLANQVEH